MPPWVWMFSFDDSWNASVALTRAVAAAIGSSLGVGRERPRAVVAVRMRQRVGDVHVRELVFDRLERRDRPTECEAAEGVLLRHVQRSLRAADLLE